MKHLIKLGILSLIAFLVLGCSEKGEKTEINNAEPEDNGVVYDSLIINFVGRDSVSVFDLLMESHQVDYLTSTIGNFVKGIDSIEINNNFSWMYSVNDTMGTIASDRFITSDSDLVKWHYRKQ